MPGRGLVHILAFTKQYSTDFISPRLHVLLIETKGRNALYMFPSSWHYLKAGLSPLLKLHDFFTVQITSTFQ